MCAQAPCAAAGDHPRTAEAELSSSRPWRRTWRWKWCPHCRCAPGDERFQDCLIRIHPDGYVANRYTHPCRRVGAAGYRGEASLRLNEHVVCLARCVGPFLAITRYRAGDEPRVLAPYLPDRDSELPNRPGLEVL